MPATVDDLCNAMERIAPLNYAESWDNVGLIVGDRSRTLKGPVLLTIDFTEPVLEEALAHNASAVIAYHPPIFHPLKRVDDTNTRQRVLRRCIEAGMSIYSPHTAADAAIGGVTDWLADGVVGAAHHEASADRRALRPWIRQPHTEQVKLVTFVPRTHIDPVRNALASSGAGIIGNYELCSFSTDGAGTFLGGEGSSPAVGQRGTLETVDEVRLEMVCSRSAIALAIATLRTFHPYEEPAIDVYDLVGKPERTIGAGRRLMLDQPEDIAVIAQRLREHTGVPRVKVARAGDRKRISVVGICPGSGADLAQDALADGCELYVTGEMTHHEVMALLDAGVGVILCGHTSSERGWLPTLANKLCKLIDDTRFIVSTADRHPFDYL